MRKFRHFIGLAAMLTISVSPASAQQDPFRFQEATIAGIHAALAAGQLTCTQLTRLYLDRIAAYNMHGPALRAIITVNPKAMEIAGEMDRSYQASPARVGPLHCIPIILKQYPRPANDRRQCQHEGIGAARRRLHSGKDTQGRGADLGQGELAGIRAWGHVDLEPGWSGA